MKYCSFPIVFGLLFAGLIESSLAFEIREFVSKSLLQPATLDAKLKTISQATEALRSIDESPTNTEFLVLVDLGVRNAADIEGLSFPFWKGFTDKLKSSNQVRRSFIRNSNLFTFYLKQELSADKFLYSHDIGRGSTCKVISVWVLQRAFVQCDNFRSLSRGYHH